MEPKTHTAELIYGNNYVFNGVHYRKDKAVAVDEATAEQLAELDVEGRDTRTGFASSHPRFKITLIGDADIDEEEEVKTTRSRTKPSRRTAAKATR